MFFLMNKTLNSLKNPASSRVNIPKIHFSFYCKKGTVLSQMATLLAGSTPTCTVDLLANKVTFQPPE